MKVLLASLLCFVLTMSQAFAIKGGPVYPVGKSIVGTYAGVLESAFDPTDPISANSIGLFTLGVPTTGSSTGTFLMFTQGRTFTGTIQAIANPNTSSLRGLLNATFNYNLTVITRDATGAQIVNTIAVTANVNGNINATISKNTSPNAVTAALLKGTSTLFIDQGQVAASGQPVISGTLGLTVNGFQQSTVAPATGTLTGGAGG